MILEQVADDDEPLRLAQTPPDRLLDSMQAAGLLHLSPGDQYEEEEGGVAPSQIQVNADVVFRKAAWPDPSEVDAFLIQQNYASKGVKSKLLSGPTAGMTFRRTPHKKQIQCMGPQQAAMEFAAAFQLPYITQMYEPNMASNHKLSPQIQYVVFASPDDMFTVIQRRRKMKYGCVMFEVIRETGASRLYFDIDYISTDTNTGNVRARTDLAARACKEEAIALVRRHGVVTEIANSIMIKSRCAWKDGNRMYKISFHVIFPYIIFHSNYNGDMKSWAKELNEKLGGRFGEIFDYGILMADAAPLSVVDTVVYTRNRLMCMVDCVKFSDEPAVMAESVPMKIHALSSKFGQMTPAMAFALTMIAVPSDAITTACHWVAKSNVDDDDGNHQNDYLTALDSSHEIQVDMPGSEQRLVCSWAEKLYHTRVSKFNLPIMPFNAGRLQPSPNGRVFIQVPCDRYCQMKKREHIGDSAGTQTGYEICLLTSNARQTCFSCPIAAPYTKMSQVYDYDLSGMLVFGGTDTKIASAIAEEFCDQKYVAVLAVSGQPQNTQIYIWDGSMANNKEYNLFFGNRSNLWLPIDKGHFKVAIVSSWLERKFGLLRAASAGMQKRKKEIEKAFKMRMQAGKLTQVTTDALTIMCDRVGNSSFADRFNKSPYLIATNDGCVVDLSTRTKIARNADHMFTQFANFSLLDTSHADARARVDKFAAFVLQICDGVIEKRDYIQKIFGYSLTAVHYDRRIYAHLGPGANGKSSLDECFRDSLSEFHKSVRSSFLARKSASTNSSASACPDLMQLRHARMIVCNETSEKTRMDDARFKVMADGSKQSARQLYGTEEQMQLPGKVHILSNFMPSFCGQGTHTHTHT